MGLVHADIELVRGDDMALQRMGRLPKSRVRRVKVEALVDSGAYMLGINEEIRHKLKLSTLDRKLAELADGSCVYVDIVGPVEVHFGNRKANVDAMVLPGKSQVLLGAIPMEYMDILIDPKRQKLIANPEHPDFPVIRI